MSRNIKLSINEYYHLYNRGTDKRIVFQDKKDYERFIALLYLCNNNKHLSFKDSVKKELDASVVHFSNNTTSPLVAIGAYCLMPNHFHILVREIEDEGISKFMQKLSTAYTMYFNIKNKRSGALFQGRFKAEHLDSDPYLKYMFSYIHLNPVKLIDKNWKENGIRDKNKTRQYLKSYKYSSYLDYLGEKRVTFKILTIKNFPKYFPNKTSFEKCIDEWLSYKDRMN